MNNYKDSLSSTADALKDLTGNAGKFSAAQMDLTSKTALNGKAFEQTTDIFGGLSDTFKDATKNQSLFADVSNYVTDTVDKGKDVIKDATEGLTNFGGAAEDAGAKASKGSKGIKDFYESMVSTIEGQLDIFSKFEIKTETSAKTMLENMQSNIDGMASWSHRMTVLAERGIDQGLLQKLAELGPKGYDTMNAFYEMSEEELKKANELYATSLTLPQGQADIIASAYQYCGEMSILGFSNALDDHRKLHESIHGIKKDTDKDLKEDFEIGSPSKYMMRMGGYLMAGLINGITDNSVLDRLRVAIVNIVCFKIKEHFETELKPSTFESIGKGVVQGLADGISKNANLVDEASAGLGEKATKATKKSVKSNSPSKVFMEIGRFMSEGLAIGILDAASNVEQAAASVSEGAIDTISDLGRIQDTISSELDLSPVITPLLDLSYLRQQMSEVNGMFNSRRLSAFDDFGQNEGNGLVQQVNYTQNNYSPKALSRIEIYRQTKNQISMLKGATANA